MSEWKTYEPWLEELRDSAAIEGVDLQEDKYHYHTYFMRGYSTSAVIDGIKEQPKPLTDEELAFQRFAD